MKNIFDIQQLSQFEFGAIIVTVLVAGLVFGCLIAYALLKRKTKPDMEAAAAIKEEFEEYKDKVDDHFNKTSEMFKDVTTQYKKLYDHMAVGAIELSKTDTISMPRLEMQDTAEPEPGQEDAVIDDAQIESTVDTGDEVTSGRVEDPAGSRQENLETPGHQTDHEDVDKNTAQKG